MSNQFAQGSLSVFGDTKTGRHGRSPWRLLGITLFILSLFLLLGASTTSAASQTIPTISIVSVVTDQTVTIQTHNYPRGQIFTVRMNYMGTAGVGGEVVGTFDSSRGDSTATYTIPTFLRGQQQIAIRLDSAQGYYSFNWFWNNTTGTSGGSGGQPVPPPSYVGIPTFSIVSVTTDTNVTILTSNFPPNQLFDVTMGLMYTQGIGGIKVGEINSGAGGAIQQTFNIPAELRGQARIAIRAQTRHANPFYAYNWFWNNTTGGSTGGQPTPTPPIVVVPPVTGIPTIKICQVARDSTVQFQTANYPANMNFTVTMGAMGTQGLLGFPAGTFNSGAGGVARYTMPIPDGVKGLSQIAIRAQGSPYFSYNWFWNTTTSADFCTG